jgi:hypothetical protein
MHIHPVLKLTVDGKPVILPKNIGISPSLWKDHSLDQYGMQAMINMYMPATAAMGTESNNGVVGIAPSANIHLVSSSIYGAGLILMVKQ